MLPYRIYPLYRSAIIVFLACQVVKAQIDLTVKETSGSKRTQEYVHNGIPVARALGLTDPSSLSIVDDKGQKVSSQFEVLSRWGGGVKGANPIQWLLVTFPVNVNANDSAKYTVVKGQPATGAYSLQVQEDATGIVVNTGAAKFKISKTVFNVFEEATLAGATPATLGGGSGGFASMTVDGKAIMKCGPPEEVTIEHAGNLFATIKVMGHFDNVPFGTAKWKYVARYSFYSGSSSAEVDFGFAFPGNKEGTEDRASYEITDATTELVKILNVKLSLPLTLGGSETGFANAEPTNSLSAPLTSGASVSLEQKLRQKMNAPALYQISSSGTVQKTGTFATAPFVGAKGKNGSVGASIQLMKFYEPQSIKATATNLEVNIVSDSQWISPFSGAFAKVTIDLASPKANSDSATTNALNQLERRVVAWPSRAYVANSFVMEEVWDGRPNSIAQTYWNKLSGVTANTIKGNVTYGMHGFMTYGLTPRYWFDGLYSNEFGNVNTWDGYFRGGTFTDYHNAFANVTLQFAQSGDGSLLQGLSFPAARRVLHTLIIQGEKDSKNFYTGWASTGYGSYRQNFNGCHSYFENLFYYYYLTGDREVLDVLQPGGQKLRNSYSRKPDGSLVPSTLLPLDPTENTVDRVGTQLGEIDFFLGHASNDSTFLGDFLNRYNRLLDLYSVLLKNGGKEYAFITDATVGTNPHVMTTTQSWMVGLYDTQNLWNLYKEFGDVKLGASGVPISRFFSSLYNSYWDYTAKLYGDSANYNGKWANQITVTWTGDKIGGNILTVLPVTVGEATLYSSSKACLAGFMFRAAYMNKSQEMYDRSSDFLQNVIMSTKPEIAWAKESSELYLRVHAAIGQMASGLYGQVKPISGIKKKESRTSPTSAPILSAETDVFKRQVQINYQLKSADTIWMGVFNTEGKLESELISKRKVPAGSYELIWDYSDRSGKRMILGPSILQLRIGNDTQRTSLLLR